MSGTIAFRNDGRYDLVPDQMRRMSRRLAHGTPTDRALDCK
jgi:hypothetical protein